MSTSQTVRFNHHHRRRRCSSGIFFVLFVSNFLVHLSECHGNSDTEIVLKPHVTRETDLYYKTELYETKNGTGSVVPWEDVLKHTAYLTLSENQENNVNFNDESRLHLEEALRAASMVGFDSRVVPQFGDIVMLAMGTLERNLDDNTYTFVRSKSICNEEDQIDINCLRKMPSNVTALWSVQKVRHRDAKGIYRFQLRFGIITMDPKRRHRRAENHELPLKQFVAKQEDYPSLFNGQFSDSDLKKRSDFFEDAQPISSSTTTAGEAPKPSAAPIQPESPTSDHYSPSIDRTIFDLLPFFGDDEDSLKASASQHHPQASGYYASPSIAGGAPGSPYRYSYPRQPRPVASASDYYNYYSAHPGAHAPPYRPRQPRPAYPSSYSTPSFLSLFNPLSSGSNVRPVTYKHHSPSPHDYVRYPDSTFSYSSPFKSYAPPAQYHYTNNHPAVSAAATLPHSPYTAPILSQMIASTANFNPISYFLNRNRAPTVSPSASRPYNYYQRPPPHHHHQVHQPPPSFFDYKPAESNPFPKKAVYYTNAQPSYDMNLLARPPSTIYKDAMNAAYSVQNQKFIPAQQISSVLSPQLSLFNPQTSFFPSFSAPSAPQFPPSSPASPISPFHQLSNPFVVQHMQMIPISAAQQQQQPQPQQSQQFHPQFIAQLSIPLTETRPATNYRFPPSIPLHDPESASVRPPTAPTTTTTTATSPHSPPASSSYTRGKDLFEMAREPKHRGKFSEPDPLYAKEVASTISTILNKIQATPKVSYFFPKEDDSVFKPHFPLVPASTVRKNHSDGDFKHLLTHHHQMPSYQKLNNFFVTSGKGGVIYATPSSLPLQAVAYVKKQPSNIIYGQVMDSKVVPPPTPHRPEHLKEFAKSQLSPPSKGTNQPPAVSPSPTPVKPRTTQVPTKRATPMNLITPPSTTTTTSAPRTTTTTTSTTASTTHVPSSTSSRKPLTSTATTTTRGTPEPQTTPFTQRNPRGRQYSRNKVTTTTTEKPVLKWMPKRKRPKQEPTKIAATLNNSGTALPRPHISNRTRVVAQASSIRPVIIPLDDVSMGPEEAHFQRRQYVQATASPSFVERATKLPSTRNKKRKKHQDFTNYVTAPPTTVTPSRSTSAAPVAAASTLFQGDESIPEPQKNVFTTTTPTSYPMTTTTGAPMIIPTFTSRSVPSTTPVPETIVHTLERDIYTTSAVPHFLPTIPAESQMVPVVPLELFELSKAAAVVKPIETDTPDVEFFRASPRDEEEDGEEEDHHTDRDDDDEDDDGDNEEHHADADDDDDDEEGGVGGGLNFIAKSIAKVFSDASTNEVDGATVSGAAEGEESPSHPAISSSSSGGVKAEGDEEEEED